MFAINKIKLVFVVKFRSKILPSFNFQIQCFQIKNISKAVLKWHFLIKIRDIFSFLSSKQTPNVLKIRGGEKNGKR